MTFPIEEPVNPKPRRGFLVPGRSRAFGESSYPLITHMAWGEGIADYIQRNGGIHIPALARALGWSIGRVTGVIQSGLKAANPTVELGPHHSLPFRRSAQSYRLTAYGLALANAINDRQIEELNKGGDING